MTELPLSPFRVLVTGAGGFVGRHLISALSIALPGGSVIIATSLSDSESSDYPNVRMVQLDVTSAEQVQAVLAATRPTHLFHLAAIAAIPAAQQDVRQTWQVNFSGAFNVALGILETIPECRLIYCGSALVYGTNPTNHQPIPETAQLNPDTAYGASKAAADIMIGQMSKQGLKALRLRPFNHTGPGQSEDFVVPAFAGQIARIERGLQAPVIRVGGLDNRRDFLDVRDVVRAYVKTVIHFDDLPARCVLNIASGSAWTIRSILNTLLALSSEPITVIQDEHLLRNTENSTIIGDGKIARNLLNWVPEIEFSTTLASVLDYCRRT